MFVCLCACVCMYVHTYVRMYVNIYIYACTCARTRLCIRVCAHAFMHVCMYLSIHGYIYLSTHHLCDSVPMCLFKCKCILHVNVNADVNVYVHVNASGGKTAPAFWPFLKTYILSVTCTSGRYVTGLVGVGMLTFMFTCVTCTSDVTSLGWGGGDINVHVHLHHMPIWRYNAGLGG